jgi:8-oxo-dGTP diphosphatase
MPEPHAELPAVGDGPLESRLEGNQPETCLCFLTRAASSESPASVLLGHKRRGLGSGNIVGLGGHLEPGETAAAAAVREVAEESGCVVAEADLGERARIDFRFPYRRAWEMSATVFVTSRWSGRPVATDEIVPSWHPIDALPVDDMWDDARYWLARVLAGERLDAVFTFGPDCATVETCEVRSRTRSTTFRAAVPGRPPTHR